MFKYIPLFLLLCFCYSTTNAQVNSRNGFYHPVHGKLRILYIFAEVTNDPANVNYPEWPAGQMPPNATEYLDTSIIPGSINGYLSNYYYQASFGDFQVEGDYINMLVQLPYNPNKTYNERSVIEYLDSLPGSDIITARGKSINGDYFDTWGNYGYGLPKSNVGDSKIDMVLVIWRVNSKFKPSGSGEVSTLRFNVPLKNKIGFNGHGQFVTDRSNEFSTMRHELSHVLIGFDNFHTHLGAGDRKILTVPGGYGILSSWPSISGTWNGYDRHRLGWKPVSNSYYISALNPQTLTETETDISANSLSSAFQFEFRLRDFVQYGDAVRIQMPYLQTNDTPSPVHYQYLWLENHQVLPVNFDHHDKHRGLNAYIQIGKDDMSDFIEDNNYIYQLSALGAYDIIQDPANSTLNLNKDRANPFTGYYAMGLPIYDNINPNVIVDGNTHDTTLVYDEIYSYEYNISEWIKLNGQLLNKDSFATISGTISDTFGIGRKISLSSNPAITPILTYKTPDGSGPNLTPQIYDNRIIHLNGISIDVLEAIPNTNGHGDDIKIRIRWNEWNVEQDVRWCAEQIWLHDTVNLAQSKTITIDQGYTPQRPINPQIINGEKIFASPTTFRCLNGSLLHLDPYSNVVLDHNSTLVLESGSKLEVHTGANVVVRGGCTLLLKPGAQAFVHDGGRITVERGGRLVWNDDAQLVLDGGNSILKLNEGRLEIADSTTFTYTGEGYIDIFNDYLSPRPNIVSSTGGGATFRLNGSSVTDILLVASGSEGVEFDKDISVELMNGTILMHAMGGYGPRLNAFSGLQVENINMLTTDSSDGSLHRGLHIYGQPDVHITDFTVYHGKWGIRAPIFYGTYSPLIQNFSAYNCLTGIYTRGGQLALMNADLDYNTTGWHAEGMVGESHISGTIDYNTSKGIDYGGSSSALLRLEANVTHNTQGVFMFSSPVSAYCKSITNNAVGFYMTQNSLLKLSPRMNYRNAGKCAVGNTNNAIVSEYAQDLELDSGRNNLASGGLEMFGYVLSPTIHAAKNYWGTSQPAFGSHYDLQYFHQSPFSGGFLVYPASVITSQNTYTLDAGSCIMPPGPPDQPGGGDHQLARPRYHDDNMNIVLENGAFIGYTLDSAVSTLAWYNFLDSTAQMDSVIRLSHAILTEVIDFPDLHEPHWDIIHSTYNK